jgi:quercetin dioxygenase-like cupin family protein
MGEYALSNQCNQEGVRTVGREIRRVVTGVTAEGNSVVVSDDGVPPTAIRLIQGVEFYLMWGTEDGVPAVGPQDPTPHVQPFFPGPGGTRLQFVRLMPAEVHEQAAPIEELLAEAEATFHGMVSAFEPGRPGVHTTDSVDYGIVVDGDVHMELDGGVEVPLSAGDVVVQRGARHAWHNYGDKPALLMFAMIGARRQD